MNADFFFKHHAWFFSLFLTRFWNFKVIYLVSPLSFHPFYMKSYFYGCYFIIISHSILNKLVAFLLYSVFFFLDSFRYTHIHADVIIFVQVLLLLVTLERDSWRENVSPSLILLIFFWQLLLLYNFISDEWYVDRLNLNDIHLLSIIKIEKYPSILRPLK